MKVSFDQPDINVVNGSPFPWTVDDALGYLVMFVRRDADGKPFVAYSVGRDTVQDKDEAETEELLELMERLEQAARDAIAPRAEVYGKS